MIFSKWGSFARFILMTTCIGAASGVGFYIYFMAPIGFADLVDGLSIIHYFIGLGALAGLFLGAPAYGAVRLAVGRLRNRVVATLFFFALGFASAVLAILVLVLLFGGLSGLALDSLMEIFPQGLTLAAIAGLLTAAASFLVVEPAAPAITRLGSPVTGSSTDPSRADHRGHHRYG